jgi:hypothetical protein
MQYFAASLLIIINQPIGLCVYRMRRIMNVWNFFPRYEE